MNLFTCFQIILSKNNYEYMIPNNLNENKEKNNIREKDTNEETMYMFPYIS